MRLHNILVESPLSKTIIRAPAVIDRVTLQTLASMITDHAQEWMVESQEGRLIFYRGTTSHPDYALAFVKDVRTDRKPKDTEELHHKILNAMIDAAGGTANRSNTAAITSNESDAYDYGLPYVAIPLGDFAYTWSPVWKDWYSFSGERVFYKQVTNLLKPELADKFLLNPEEAHRQYQALLQSLQDSYADEQDPMGRAVFRAQIERLKQPDKRAAQYAAYTRADRDIPVNTLLKPQNYDVNALSELIIVDRGLSYAFSKNHEVMVACDKILYIAPPIYELVIKIIHSREVTDRDIAQYDAVIRRRYWPELSPNEETD